MHRLILAFSLGIAGLNAAETVLGDPAFTPTPERPLGWRGDGSGVFAGATCPTGWNVANGQGLAWKATLPLGATCGSIPAAVGKRLYVRTWTELLCIGE